MTGTSANRLYVFEGSYNSDQMEGRGAQISTGPFTTPEQAYLSIRGKGGMGVKDGSVYRVTVQTIYTSQDAEERVQIYDGYRKQWTREYQNLVIPRTLTEVFDAAITTLRAAVGSDPEPAALGAAVMMRNTGDRAMIVQAALLLPDTARTLGETAVAEALTAAVNAGC